MNSIKGGRGKKAPYKTTHVRVPENIKHLVDNLCNSYKNHVIESGSLNINEQQFIIDTFGLEKSSSNKSRALNSTTTKQSTIVDKNENEIREILITILSSPSNKGGAIKSLVADLATSIGVDVERQGRKWIVK